jgi:hypothetical protein
MAKDAIALLLVTLLRVRPWKLVENVLDRHQDHCSCGLLLAPIEHQLFLLQFFQERLRHLLHFRRLLFVRRRHRHRHYRRGGGGGGGGGRVLK